MLGAKEQNKKTNTNKGLKSWQIGKSLFEMEIAAVSGFRLLGIAQQSTSCRVAQTLHCSTNLVTKCLEMLECVIKINGIDSIM